MRKIAIVGSCVSRDPFEHLHNVELVEYAARTSFASAFQAAPFPHSLTTLDPDGAIQSPWQRRMVEQDLAKGVSAKLASLNSDTLVVIDFIDERFDLLSINGALATYSAEFRKTKAHTRLPGMALVPSGSEQHFDLWTRGFDTFLQMARAAKLRVVLNNSKWALHTESGGEIPTPIATIERNNKYLDRLFEYVSRHGVPSLFPPEFHFTAADKHKWGVASFHYVPSIYEAFAERLEPHLLS